MSQPNCPTTQLVPGPRGATGTAGTNGTNGIDAVTTTTANFTMPASSANVAVDVVETGWMAVGQYVFVQNAGFFSVNQIVTSTQVVLTNLGYTPNVAPGTVVGSGVKVAASGVSGSQGSSGSTPTFNSISPTTTKGDLIADNGVNSPNASDVRQAAGADGTLLHADSTQATGLRWDKVNLASSSEVTGVLATANGGNADRVAKAGDTMTGDLLISKTLTKLKLKDTGGAVDAKIWGFLANAGLLAFYSTDDAETVNQTWLFATRTGAVVTSVNTSGNWIFSGSLAVGSFFNRAMATNTSLANGDNNDVASFNGSYVKIKTGPTGAFAITGISTGVYSILSGLCIRLQNSTGQVMTLKHENASSIASNRINSTTGADVVCNRADLMYDPDAQRWMIFSAL